MMRFVNTLIIGFLSFLLTHPVLAGSDQNKQPFLLFCHIGHLGAPDFSRYGFTPSSIIYEQRFFDPDEDRSDPVRTAKLDQVVREIRRTVSPGTFVQLDIESWVGSNTRVRQNYLDTLRYLKQDLPEYPLGYYRVAPEWAHWNMHRDPNLLLAWQNENLERKAIFELADVIYPALYTYHGNPELWIATAQHLIAEARRHAPGKKIVPFLWPVFHPSSDVGGDGKAELSRAYWRQQLEFVRSNADGLVLWQDGQLPLWRDDLPWWQETLDFLRMHFPPVDTSSSPLASSELSAQEYPLGDAQR